MGSAPTKRPVVLGIEQNYDLTLNYCQAFRKKFLYDDPEKKKKCVFLTCFDKDANSGYVEVALTNNSVDFITGSGHGIYDEFTGQQGSTIWKASALKSQEFDGKIVHLLSCQTGGILGLAIVAAGAKAFWGYTVNFSFYTDPKVEKTGNYTQDKVAEPFFRLDTIIDRGIVEGKDANEIYDSMKRFFWQVFQQLLLHSPRVAAAFLDNFVHLASPALNWGDPAAKL